MLSRLIICLGLVFVTFSVVDGRVYGVVSIFGVETVLVLPVNVFFNLSILYSLVKLQHFASWVFCLLQVEKKQILAVGPPG